MQGQRPDGFPTAFPGAPVQFPNTGALFDLFGAQAPPQVGPPKPHFTKVGNELVPDPLPESGLHQDAYKAWINRADDPQEELRRRQAVHEILGDPRTAWAHGARVADIQPITGDPERDAQIRRLLERKDNPFREGVKSAAGWTAGALRGGEGQAAASIARTLADPTRKGIATDPLDATFGELFTEVLPFALGQSLPAILAGTAAVATGGLAAGAAGLGGIGTAVAGIGAGAAVSSPWSIEEARSDFQERTGRGATAEEDVKLVRGGLLASGVESAASAIPPLRLIGAKLPFERLGRLVMAGRKKQAAKLVTDVIQKSGARRVAEFVADVGAQTAAEALTEGSGEAIRKTGTAWALGEEFGGGDLREAVSEAIIGGLIGLPMATGAAIAGDARRTERRRRGQRVGEAQDTVAEEVGEAENIDREWGPDRIREAEGILGEENEQSPIPGDTEEYIDTIRRARQEGSRGRIEEMLNAGRLDEARGAWERTPEFDRSADEALVERLGVAGPPATRGEPGIGAPAWPHQPPNVPVQVPESHHLLPPISEMFPPPAQPQLGPGQPGGPLTPADQAPPPPDQPPPPPPPDQPPMSLQKKRAVVRLTATALRAALDGNQEAVAKARERFLRLAPQFAEQFDATIQRGVEASAQGQPVGEFLKQILEGNVTESRTRAGNAEVLRRGQRAGEIRHEPGRPDAAGEKAAVRGRSAERRAALKEEPPTEAVAETQAQKVETPPPEYLGGVAFDPGGNIRFQKGLEAPIPDQLVPRLRNWYTVARQGTPKQAAQAKREAEALASRDVGPRLRRIARRMAAELAERASLGGRVQPGPGSAPPARKPEAPETKEPGVAGGGKEAGGFVDSHWADWQRAGTDNNPNAVKAALGQMGQVDTDRLPETRRRSFRALKGKLDVHLNDLQKGGATALPKADPKALDTGEDRPGKPGQMDAGEYRGGESIPIVYRVIPLSEIRVSQDEGYDRGVQPRTWTPESAKLVARIAKDPKPSRLLESELAQIGAPVVAPFKTAGQRDVEVGNHRMAGLREAFRSGNADTRYLPRLKELYPEAAQIEQPVLVRMRTEGLSAEQRKAFLDGANETETQTMSASDHSKNIAPALERLFEANAEADPARAESVKQPHGWYGSSGTEIVGAVDGAPGQATLHQTIAENLPTMEAQALWRHGAAGRTPRPQLYAQGRAALIQAAYQNERITALVGEGGDDVVNLARGFVDAAPKFLWLRNLVKRHLVPDGYDVAADLAQTVVDLLPLTNKADAYEGQSMFASGARVPIKKRLAELLTLPRRPNQAESAKDPGGTRKYRRFGTGASIRGALGRLVENMAQHADPARARRGAGALTFGAAPAVPKAPSVVEILDRTIRQIRKEAKKNGARPAAGKGTGEESASGAGEADARGGGDAGAGDRALGGQTGDGGRGRPAAGRRNPVVEGAGRDGRGAGGGGAAEGEGGVPDGSGVEELDGALARLNRVRPVNEMLADAKQKPVPRRPGLDDRRAARPQPRPGGVRAPDRDRGRALLHHRGDERGEGPDDAVLHQGQGRAAPDLQRDEHAPAGTPGGTGPGSSEDGPAGPGPGHAKRRPRRGRGRRYGRRSGPGGRLLQGGSRGRFSRGGPGRGGATRGHRGHRRGRDRGPPDPLRAAVAGGFVRHSDPARSRGGAAAGA